MAVPEHDSSRVRRSLAARIIVRIAAGLAFFGLLLFLPAGSLRFWQAWVYGLTLTLPLCFVIAYFLKKDPDLLERRLLFLIGTPAVLVLRIKDEEKFLVANLPGYGDYCRKTRYRLIPFVW